MVSRRSSAIDMNHSVNLRFTPASPPRSRALSRPHIELRKVLRTSCCVIVLPPLRYFLLPNMLLATARVVPMKSTPG